MALTHMQMRCTLSRPLLRFVRRVVVSVWFLLSLCVLNYVVVRYCVADMRWHVAQLHQTRTVVGPGRFPTLPRLRCPDFLAIVVCSAVGHFEERAAVRGTWARDAVSRRSSVFFLVGFTDSTPGGAILQERLANESAHYGDIIQADFRDTYRNLTLKSVFLLKWAFMYCSRARFVLKTDDDVFVNVPNMVHLLKTLQITNGQTRPFVVGNMRRNTTADRGLGHKNYLPQSVFPKDDLPLYGSGTAYVMSDDAVRPLFTEALLTPFLYVEDIFITGLVAQKVGIDKIHSDCFVCCRQVRNMCEYSTVVTAHELEPEPMRTVWSFVRNSSAACPRPVDRICSPRVPRSHFDDGAVAMVTNVEDANKQLFAP